MLIKGKILISFLIPHRLPLEEYYLSYCYFLSYTHVLYSIMTIAYNVPGVTFNEGYKPVILFFKYCLKT